MFRVYPKDLQAVTGPNASMQGLSDEEPFTVQAVLQRFHPFPARTLSPMLPTPRSISISCVVEQIFVAASMSNYITPKEPHPPFAFHC